MNTHKTKKPKKHLLQVIGTVGPTGLWLLLFLSLPLLYIMVISIMTSSFYRMVEWKFSLESYASLLKATYLRIIWDSIVLAFQTSLLCLLIAYPFAYILAKMPPVLKGFCILFVMLPFWINGLIRLDGWANIIRDSGLINTLLMKLGIIDEPIRMFKTYGSTLFGMVYTFLPYMILPLHTSISKIDHSLVEASHDLGAGRIRTFVRVIFPLTLPGIFSGTIQVFIPSLGAYYIADMMGDNQQFLGDLIRDLFLTNRNWPAGAALAVILILFTLAALKLYSKIGDLDDLA